MTISTIKMTPSIYSKESRDYQLISRIYDAVFNYSKMGIDGIVNIPLSKNVDERFLDLIAKTLGFESKHNYNSENLFALVSSFKKIMSKKGTIKAIEECVSMLLKSQNIRENFIVNTTEKSYTVKIYVPTELSDIILLEDMLNYILPAGFVYEIYARDLGQSLIDESFAMENQQVSISGTSQQFSRIDSYTNTSLVTEEPTAQDIDDSQSGKDYIDGN